MSKRTASERLAHTITKSGCWEWDGYKNSAGYGVLSYQSQMYLAHRLAYETWIGPIPDGLLVCHTCDNPPCINPDHLYVGTQQDNMKDMAKRKRSYWGNVTHCKSGHEFTGISSQGYRICRTCKNANNRRYKAKVKAK